MAYTPILLGTLEGDGTGDKLRAGGVKLNAMLTELYGSVTLNGFLAPAAITVASTNNYNPGGGWPIAISRLDLNPNTVNSTLTGLLAAADGQQVWIRNVGTFNLILSVQDALSSAANRFAGITGSLTLLPGARAGLVYYAGSVNRWST